MQKLIAGAGKLGFELSQEQLEQFDTYYRELIDWNQRLNLTAITEYEEVQLRHFLDSLTITLVLKPPPAEGFNIIDVGTGGFPAAGAGRINPALLRNWWPPYCPEEGSH